MKAAVLRAAGAPLSVEDVMLGDVSPREVRIANRAVGVCHSDLHFAEGHVPHPLPTILGHEAAGVVLAVGSEVRSVRPGDHVVACLSAFCGHCGDCVTGRLSLCGTGETRRRDDAPPRLTIGGETIHQFVNLSAFAQEMLVHENACVAISPDMPFDRAALLGCAVVTGVGAAINSAGIRPGQSVAVIGCGGVGLSAINGAAIAGAGRIIAIDRQPAKLDLARRFGATDCVEAGRDVADSIVEMTGGGVDHAIEAIGLKATVESAFAMLRPGGIATVAGMMPPGVKVEVDGFSLLAERRLQGSNMGSNHFPVDIPRYVDFYMSGRLNLDDLVAAHIELDAIDNAFAALRGGAAARSVVMFA
ncbi:Zn-dependent alcohol dehydrogenase [Sphingobium sp. SA916]|uniref:Zn-dependent alcohol dehydrogenase n=1 Tax=Sphingobium sp. SA916 TaxID=1851207 RepID=UPI000C9F7BF4|nr:Zn-dependent alcohol dehydrogenase [Sphingobium sp. SA916]PNQ02346.1 alcohol dehydrogenase [Sphingobium sp. SA916]